MKALNQLDNMAKARLLHQLFTNEIPALTDFVQGMCDAVKENDDLNRAKWNNGLFTFDFWLALAGEVEKKINRYGAKLHKSSALFSDQLFEGYLACLPFIVL